MAAADIGRTTVTITTVPDRDTEGNNKKRAEHIRSFCVDRTRGHALAGVRVQRVQKVHKVQRVVVGGLGKW